MVNVPYSFVLRERVYIYCSHWTKTLEKPGTFAWNLVINLTQAHSDTLKFKFRSTCGLKKFRLLSNVELISIVENECRTLLSFLDNFCFYLFINLYTSSYFFILKHYIFLRKRHHELWVSFLKPPMKLTINLVSHGNGPTNLFIYFFI